MFTLRFLFTVLVLALLFQSCGSFQRDIEIEVPPSTKIPVVECYLTPGGIFRLALTRSISYYEIPDNIPFLDSATVTISFDTTTVVLENTLTIDFESGQIFNYYANQTVPPLYYSEFTLNISTQQGEQLSARTRLYPPVAGWVYSLSEVNDDTLRYVLTSFRDLPDEENHYRLTRHLGTIYEESYTDFTFEDNFLDDDSLTLGSGYDFRTGDTLITTIYSIDRDFDIFLQSAFNASQANGNPFAQPTNIYTNIEGGGTGVFAAFSFLRDTLYLP